MSGSTDPYVTLTISPDPGLSFDLQAMEATEELGRPFLIVLDVSSQTAKGDLQPMLGTSATVTLTHPTKPKRYFNGIVARATYRGLTGGAYRYRIELRPLIWLLSHVQDCKIFQNQSPWAIINSVLGAGGVTGVEDKRQNQAGSTVLDYCVQYRESSFDFVTRLMEQYGIYYYFTHHNGSHSINLADDPNSHSSVGTIPYRYDQTGWRSADDHLWDWSAEAQIQPGATAMRDYNFTTPAADLTTKSIFAGPHEYGTKEVYDYPGLYDTADNGSKIVDVRMQEFEARRQSFGGTSNSRLIEAGGKFSLSGFPDAPVNQEYLITESVCSFTAAEARTTQDGDLRDSYQCVLRGIPGTRPFRLRPLTPRPMIRGPQTALVVGTAGDEITTDQYGRIKVQFYWDRIGTKDENSSCWIRVAHSWAGAGWGSIIIPRIGQEVVVEFLEGNPDRPLVTGVVYNATQTVPYPLPDNKTRSTLKSNSSLGGGGYNEFRFEDKKGSEEIFMQAQKDLNVVVLNNETMTVTQDSTTEVKQGNRKVTVDVGDDTHTVTQGNRSVTVSAGNDTHTVSQGNRSVTVSMGNDSLTVSLGNHSITVSVGTSTIEALQGITLKSGPSSLSITPTGITLSSPQVSATADASMSLTGGASMSLTAGMISIN